MGQILDSNKGLIPIALGPLTIWLGNPHHSRKSILNKVQSNFLGRAKDTWTHKRNYGFFDGTYLASNPQIWAEQQIGIACATHLGEHILRLHGQMTYSPNNDDEDDASVGGSVTLVETYNFDVCQLIDH